MRSIWKGSISFGLVTIPIRVVSATENHSVSFRQVHTTDGGRIRYRKVCELDEQEVAAEEIGKAYETADGNRVQLTDDELASLPLPTAKTVEILAFVPAEEIDPIQLDRSYYLTPDGQGAGKPYVLLREALARSGKVAVAKLALRGRESLGMLRVYDETLTLHTMLWPDEIRPAEGMAPSGTVTVRDAELDLADTLMETLGELDEEDLRDEYREALERLVAAKEEGEPLPVGAEAAPREGRVVDLMSVLESSVQAARESRGEHRGERREEEAEVHELRTGGGRSPRKTAAQRTQKTQKTQKATGEAGAGTAGKAAGKKAAEKAAEKKTATGGRKTAAQKTTGKAAGTKKAAAGKTASGSRTTAKKTAAREPAKKTASRKPAPRKSA
ncbi:Ku protein [Streptomyces sp. JJ36]|uniref:non-homologous end joining protein Ku n=1 Tax=Streptomyces sp. JJ36 TaxID=2736645 RepID=UPI001F02E5F9|nr:Ku protein [Streptomyces sp. JJ36]MCF6526141.1 Ku protein [Streptomyces sp. JJ36]